MASFVYSSDSDKYRDITSTPQSLVPYPIVSHFPRPTGDDISRGYMIRYFVRQINHPDGDIIEITKSDWEKLKLSTLYITVELYWRVSGALEDVITGSIRTYTGVKTANRLSLEEADKVLPGMLNQIRNQLQFYVGN